MLVEYFREMENRVIRVSLFGNLDKRQSELLDALPYDFRTSDAIDIGRTISMSESTVKRFLKNSVLFKKEEHRRYSKMSYDHEIKIYNHQDIQSLYHQNIQASYH